MRRVTLVLLLLALGLAIPVSILVVRALESAAVEEENRHRLIAERAFDEMESTLSRFLAGEEARPFDAYRFYPSGEPPDRSPLAAAPSMPFVVGYFQIDPDGSFHTPRVPRNIDVAVARGDFDPSSPTVDLPGVLEDAWQRAARLRDDTKRAKLEKEARPGKEQQGPADRTTAEDSWGLADLETVMAEVLVEAEATPTLGEGKNSAHAGGRLAAKAKGAPTPSPARNNREDDAEADLDADLEEKKDPDGFDLYRSFNLATKRRQEQRQQKLESVPRRALAPSAPAATPLASASPESAAPFASLAPPTLAQASERTRVDGFASDAPVPAPEERTVRVAVEPMNGRAAPGERLVLYRTVVADAQGYRQGLLVDWGKLGAWLDEQVIEPSGVRGAGARTTFYSTNSTNSIGATRSTPSTPAMSASDSAYVYHHPFAEPFDAFGVQLQLPVLPGGRGTGTIHALAALLAIVAVAGLLAVHRMVRVVVQFAERRSHFAASVSHELKTPLTSIRMYGEMLRDGLVPTDAKRAEYYHTITDESERLSRLIDNVLDFSRLERGEYEVRTTSGDLGPVVEEATEKVAPYARRQDFAVRLERDPELPEVVFDRDAVTQIIFNLVDNALKYARDADPREIVIGLRGDEDELVLSVRDFGPGIPAADVPRIFEAFYRRDDQETRATRGSGIGLALVRQLAGSMGGRVSADNAPGGGLRVSVTFRPARAAARD